MKTLTLAGAFALLASTALAAPNHVGLICKGTQTTYGSSGEKDTPWERVFSMDFDGSKGWVVDAQGQFDIVATETRIAFWKGYEINRTTGHLSGWDDNKYLPMRVSAECEPTKYTPIPAKKF